VGRRELHRVVHHHGIAAVKTARDAGRLDVLHHPGVIAHLVVTEALAQVGVQVDLFDHAVPLAFFPSSAGWALRAASHPAWACSTSMGARPTRFSYSAGA